MRTLVIVPIYNYFELVNKIVSFYNHSLDEADVLIVNDGKIIPNLIYDNHDYSYANNPPDFHGDLRYIYSHYYDESEYDCIIINEHDVLPNEQSLYACMDTFENCDQWCASVSCMYNWRGIPCYPGNPNWLLEEPYIKNHCGVISRVNKMGVPFAFSLWKPHALKLINDNQLPKLWKLDSAFGIILNNAGYYHLRLKDYYVEHAQGGIKSWHKP